MPAQPPDLTPTLTPIAELSALDIIALILSAALSQSKYELLIENYFNKIAPMDNKLYIHTTEGKDDMPAHIKSSLTNNQISLSVENGELLLGTWQGIYLFEHRLNPQTRTIIHHFLGEV